MAAIQDTSNKNFKKFNNKKHFPLRGMWQILKNFGNKYKKKTFYVLFIILYWKEQHRIVWFCPFKSRSSDKLSFCYEKKRIKIWIQTRG
jgi:hypothetical protein